MTTEEMSKYVFLDESPDLRADVAFVFGTNKAWRESSRRAADLYLKGLVPRIIVTGGVVGDGHREVEAVVHANELVRLGVARRDILIEDRSTNTLENVVLAREVLDREVGLAKVARIAVVVKNGHSRRALMTLRRHMPGHIGLLVAPYVPGYLGVTKADWSESEAGRKMVKGELDRIGKYLKKGDIQELDL
jgi:uncharacterized SAM-binding protein YcdF (DUF218 family)